MNYSLKKNNAFKHKGEGTYFSCSHEFDDHRCARLKKPQQFSQPKCLANPLLLNYVFCYAFVNALDNLLIVNVLFICKMEEDNLIMY